MRRRIGVNALNGQHPFLQENSSGGTDKGKGVSMP